MITFATPIESLRTVGPKVSKALHRLEIDTAGDLLGYEPFRYEDFSSILPIARLTAGQVATVKGKIELIGSRRSFRKRLTITEAALRDSTGYLKLVWFNQPYIVKMLKPGDQIMVSGKPDWQYGTFQMTGPSYERVQADQAHVGRIVPIYGVTEGITPKHIRMLVHQILPLAENIVDPLPLTIRKQEGLPELKDAIRSMHYPKSNPDLLLSQKRRIFDTLLRIQIEGMKMRSLLRSNSAPVLKFHEAKTKQFVDSLPFQLTAGQKKAAWEILSDLQKPHPMNRLLQGDVGTGKTVVALLALLNTAWSGQQSALMAPTEILAEQHFQTITKLIDGVIPIALLTGSRAVRSDSPTTTKRGLTQALARGEIALAIGTHALIQSTVKFKSLGLTVVDEQHRFGVNQRQALHEDSHKKNELLPHFLSMTATPIPRTIALALYSDLDISTIRELPKNRRSILTKLVLPAKRKEMDEFVRKQISAGHQTFVITALIDESDLLGIRAATQTQKRLQTEVFPDLRVGLLHGRMNPKAKEAVMRKFANREIDILVSTAVVEVGIDIPNATVMIIENADRFGLAQLHQFRGRVGRSDAQSYCFLLSDKESAGRDNARLNAMTKLSDGFSVAEADLKLRGPGELRGAKQSGEADIGMASLGDLELIKRAKAVASELLNQDPTLERFPGILKSLSQRGVHWE